MRDGEWVGPDGQVYRWNADKGINEIVPQRAAIDPNQDFMDRFAYTQGGAAGTGELRNYLTGLVGQGYGAADFEGALKKYLESQGLPVGDYTEEGYGYNKYNDQRHTAWWGEQDRLKAIGTGLDLMGKPTNWQSLYNPTLAQQQGQKVGEIGTQQQNNTPSDMETLMDVLKFAGAAGGLYGLGGLLGGAGAAGGAAGGASSLPSALSGAGTFEAGLGSTLGGNAGLGISQGLGASAGGVLGGAGSFADIAAGGMLGGIGGAAGIGALPSIAAEGAAIGGAGTTGVEGPLTTGGGGGGNTVGDWDFMDALDGGNTLPTGTNPYGTDLGLPPGTLPDGSVDAGANWWNKLQAAASGIPGMPSNATGWLSLLGKGIGGVLDYTSATNKADNLKEIADRTWGAGQQYRDNASRAMTPGFDLNSIPGYSGALSTGMDAFNRSLSAKNGNPWGQGGAAGEAISWAGKTIALPAWQNYFNSNSNAGGLSNLATQSTGAAMGAADADSAGYGSLGQTARNIFDPQPNYQKQYLDLLGKQYGLA